MSAVTARPAPWSVLRVFWLQHRRALIWWSVALVGTALMYSALYPSVRDSGDTFDEYIKQLPDVFKTILGEDFTSPVGYLWSQLFTSVGPIVLIVYTVGLGARAIAGEEEAGTLDLLLATPLVRSTVLRDKAVGMILGTALLSVVLCLSIWLSGKPFGLDVPLGDLAAACGLQALLALGFGFIALAIGAVTGNRSQAIAISSGTATLAYLLWAIGANLDVLRFVIPLSPFRWFTEPQPLRDGLAAVNLVVLLGIPVIAYLVAWFRLDRRDLHA